MRIPIEELLRRFKYDPDTGILTRGGALAGTLDDHGYIMVRFQNYESSAAHRMAFAIMTGEWPKGEVDHENGIRHDNRWSNLKESTPSDQRKNTALRIDNKFNITGVSYDERYTKPWYSVTHSEGVRYIQRFDDFFEACCARKSAELKHKFHPNHGKRRSKYAHRRNS